MLSVQGFLGVVLAHARQLRPRRTAGDQIATLCDHVRSLWSSPRQHTSIDRRDAWPAVAPAGDCGAVAAVISGARAQAIVVVRRGGNDVAPANIARAMARVGLYYSKVDYGCHIAHRIIAGQPLIERSPPAVVFAKQKPDHGGACCSRFCLGSAESKHALRAAGSRARPTVLLWPRCGKHPAAVATTRWFWMPSILVSINPALLVPDGAAVRKRNSVTDGSRRARP